MKNLATRFAFLLAALGITTQEADARAADTASPSVDFPSLVDRAAKWLGTAHAEAPRTRVDAAAQPLVILAPPRATVLVRDWRGSMRVSGDATLTDDLRPSASYRMGVLRASSTGRLAGYVQLGAGQWRLDPVLFPGLPCDERLTGQVGGGLQLRVTSHASIGAEALYSVVYREPEDAPAPRFVTLMLAARATF
ncbi:MAG TPA: hypothetical protein VIF62_02005 [Labilithrix sp.]